MELISDNPIKDSSNDLLGRASSAEAFAKHIFHLTIKKVWLWDYVENGEMVKHPI